MVTERLYRNRLHKADFLQSGSWFWKEQGKCSGLITIPSRTTSPRGLCKQWRRGSSACSWRLWTAIVSGKGTPILGLPRGRWSRGCVLESTPQPAGVRRGLVECSRQSRELAWGVDFRPEQGNRSQLLTWRRLCSVTSFGCSEFTPCT